MQRDREQFPCGECDCGPGGETGGRREWEIEELHESDGSAMRLTRCPAQQIGEREAHIVSMYPHYKAGHLYCEGGLRNQPATFMRLMQLCTLLDVEKGNDQRRR